MYMTRINFKIIVNKIVFHGDATLLYNTNNNYEFEIKKIPK